MGFDPENQAPEGLHRMQYAIHLLEEVLGWPSKGNAELMADCLLSISKSRRVSIEQAHSYMQRAIRLANEQGIALDRHWLMAGEYTKMRPEKEFKGTYKPIPEADRQRAQAERAEFFSSPEYHSFLQKMKSHGM